MHRRWLVVVALTFVGCFKAGDGSNGPEDSGTGSVTGTEDAGSVSDTCGNGFIDVGEQCEATPLNLNSETCATATVGVLPNGLLGCNSNCTLNVSMCTSSSGVGGMSGIGGVGGVGGGF